MTKKTRQKKPDMERNKMSSAKQTNKQTGVCRSIIIEQDGEKAKRNERKLEKREWGKKDESVALHSCSVSLSVMSIK